MDIYVGNSQVRHLIEFNEGEEIFVSFNEGMIYPKILLLEFKLEELNKGNSINSLFYDNYTNIRVIKFTNPYNNLIEISFKLSDKKFKEIINCEKRDEILRNLRRCKINEINSIELINEGYYFMYEFGFNNIEVEFFRVRVNENNETYLAYLCLRFRQVFWSILEIYGIYE